MNDEAKPHDDEVDWTDELIALEMDEGDADPDLIQLYEDNRGRVTLVDSRDLPGAPRAPRGSDGGEGEGGARS